MTLAWTYADRLNSNECSHMRMLKEKCWPMLDEKFDRNQTLANIVQHDPTSPNICQHGVQTNTTCWSQQCWMVLSQNVKSV